YHSRRGPTGSAPEFRNRYDCPLRRPSHRRPRRGKDKPMSAKRPHLLLVEALFYEHIATDLRRGAERAVAEAGATCEVISVPGSFEIPGAIAIAARANAPYDGYVALGCVIRGETTHYDHICAESARGMHDLA